MIAIPENGIDPRVWGSGAWRFMDAMVLNYPVQNPSEECSQAYMIFFSILGTLLPCSRCQTNHQQFLETRTLQDTDFESRASLLQFYFDMKNHARVFSNHPPFSSIDDMVANMIAGITRPVQAPQIPQATQVHPQLPHGMYQPRHQTTTQRRGCGGCGGRR